MTMADRSFKIFNVPRKDEVPDDVIQDLIPGASMPPFIMNAPWSKKADPRGVNKAQFMLENAQLILDTSQKRDSLQSSIDSQIAKITSNQANLQLDMKAPKIEMTYFRNWDDTYEGVLLLAKPINRHQVQMIVKGAEDQGIKMRGGGGYHSGSPIHPDNGNLMINTCDLQLPDVPNRRYKINKIGEKENWTIIVSPGCNNAEVLNDMIKEEVCFRSSVIIPTTTFGGMLSGGCHGIGSDQTPMSDWMTSMKVVNAMGDIVTIPDPNASPAEQERVLRSARVNLGTFGIIVEMTIKIWPLEKVEVNNIFDEKVDQVLGSTETLAEYLKKYWSLHIIWIPFSGLNLPYALAQPIAPTFVNWEPGNDKLYIRGINPTELEINTPRSRFTQVLDVLGQAALSVQGSIMSRIPPTTPAMLTVAYDTQLQNKEPQRMLIPWAVFFRDGLDFCYSYDMEFFFPMDIDKPDVVINAVKILKDMVKNRAQGSSGTQLGPTYPFNMFLELRFIQNSDSTICPSSFSTTHTACLDMQSMYDAQDWEPFYAELAMKWMDIGGVPHWQKQWAFNPKLMPRLKLKYADKFKEFLEVRSSLNVDPDNVFMNDTLMELFSLK